MSTKASIWSEVSPSFARKSNLLRYSKYSLLLCNHIYVCLIISSSLSSAMDSAKVMLQVVGKSLKRSFTVNVLDIALV